MKHTHPVLDSDKHFIIDPVTRAISNAEQKKTKLMQNDHNSERFSFEIDRKIEGHDLTLCNKIQVHYSNVDASKRTTNLGVYDVGDMQIHPDNPDKVIFSWLVSKNATLYSGPLNFLVLFACLENGEEVYRWSTDVNTSITVARGMDNEPYIIETFPDVLNQWKEDLYAAVYGYKVMGTGVVEPTSGPYMWLNTSVDESSEIQKYIEDNGNPSEHTGLVVVVGEDGTKKVLYPVTKLAAVEDADERMSEILDVAEEAKKIASDTGSLVETAQKAASDAQASAEEAASKAEEAANTAGGAVTAAGNAQNAANAAQQTADGKAPISHASSENTYGVGNNSTYGHVRLSASYTSATGVDGGYAATPSAVKAAYDLASGRIPKVSGATEGYIPTFKTDGTLASSGVAMSGFHRCKFSLSGTTLTITTVD